MQRRELWCTRCELWYAEDACTTSYMNDNRGVICTVIVGCPEGHAFVYVPNGVSVRFTEV